MTGDIDPKIRRILMPRSSSPVILVLLAIAVAALCVSKYNEPSTATMPSPPPEAPPVATIEIRQTTSEEFDSLKRQIEQYSQSTMDEMNARKADLQKLADQISALTDKIDALQKASASSAARAEIRRDIIQTPPRRSPHVLAVHSKPIAEPPASPGTTGPSPASSFPPILGPQSGGQ
jgi:TolA-binding protein